VKQNEARARSRSCPGDRPCAGDARLREAFSFRQGRLWGGLLDFDARKYQFEDFIEGDTARLHLRVDPHDLGCVMQTVE